MNLFSKRNKHIVFINDTIALSLTSALLYMYIVHVLVCLIKFLSNVCLKFYPFFNTSLVSMAKIITDVFLKNVPCLS